MKVPVATVYINLSNIRNFHSISPIIRFLDSYQDMNYFDFIVIYDKGQIDFIKKISFTTRDVLTTYCNRIPSNVRYISFGARGHLDYKLPKNFIKIEFIGGAIQLMSSAYLFHKINFTNKKMVNSKIDYTIHQENHSTMSITAHINSTDGVNYKVTVTKK